MLQTIPCSCGKRTTIEWPKGQSGTFRCTCGNVIDLIPRSHRSPAPPIRIPVGLVVLAGIIVAGLLGSALSPPKKQYASAPPLIELPAPNPLRSFQPLQLPPHLTAPIELPTPVSPALLNPPITEFSYATTADAAREADQGHLAAKRGQWKSAIDSFTRSIRHHPEFGETYLDRGLAYLKLGEKAKAIADFRRVLELPAPQQSREAARQQMASLGAHKGIPSEERQRTATTNPSSAVSLQRDQTPKVSEQQDTKMPTQILQGSRRRNAIAPLRIETEKGENYLLKLVNVVNSKDQMMIYVKGGESYSTKAPLGTYQIRAASGYTWYGREDLFGPNTRFVRLRAKNGTQETLQFVRKGNTVHGAILSFKRVSDGNMVQETISRDEF